MKEPEYWRINLAVEKVIAIHEHEILIDQCKAEIRKNPYMTIPCIGMLACHMATVSARLSSIRGKDEKYTATSSQSKSNRVIEIRGVFANDVLTGPQIAELMRD